MIAGLFDAYAQASSTKIIAGLFSAYSVLEIETYKPSSVVQSDLNQIFKCLKKIHLGSSQRRISEPNIGISLWKIEALFRKNYSYTLSQDVCIATLLSSIQVMMYQKTCQTLFINPFELENIMCRSLKDQIGIQNTPNH